MSSILQGLQWIAGNPLWLLLAGLPVVILIGLVSWIAGRNKKKPSPVDGRWATRSDIKRLGLFR